MTTLCTITVERKYLGTGSACLSIKAEADGLELVDCFRSFPTQLSGETLSDYIVFGPAVMGGVVTQDGVEYIHSEYGNTVPLCSLIDRESEKLVAELRDLEQTN